MSAESISWLVNYLPIIVFLIVFLWLSSRYRSNYEKYLAKHEAYMVRLEKSQEELVAVSRSIASSLTEIKRLLEEKKT